MKPSYNIFPFNVFLHPPFSLKTPSWRVGKQCCCHIKFSHIKSSENLLLIGRITKKILTCLKWSKSGHKSREGNREDPSWLQLPPFTWWSLGISEREHTLQAEMFPPPGAAGRPQKWLLGRELQHPGRSWPPWTQELMLHVFHPFQCLGM